MNNEEFSWAGDGEALAFLMKGGRYEMTPTFHIYRAVDNQKISPKELSALQYLVWEWDFGYYQTKPDKMCKTQVVSEYLKCQYCGADVAEKCRARGAL